MMRTASMRTAVLVTALAVASLVSGCGDGDADASDGTPTPPSPSVPSSTLSAEESQLEGTWTTDLRRSDVIAYIRNAGWGRRVEKALLDPNMAGPSETEFRVEFTGHYFRMSQVATDEQWQSGRWRIEGGRIFLDDEAPVGELTFRVHTDGTVATFDQPDDTGGGAEFMPGVPGWAPGAVLWASTTWSRAD